MRTAAVLAGSLATAAASSNYLGFSTGSTNIDGDVKVQADYEEEFKAAQNLVGAPGVFNAARLYTNIQGGTTDDPIEAFGAAIATNTSLLLGVWCSGTDTIEPEITALKAGLTKYGQELADRVIAISIGSEDLYRNSVTGVENKAGIGANPDVIVGFIEDYRAAFNTSLLKDVPVGHVDTWNVFPNASNHGVIEACDWIGLDEYPYYQTGEGNTIENAANLFKTAYDAAKAAVGDKPLWVTETGWPYTGMTWDEAVPSIANAKAYWDAVGCAMLFNQLPTFWYDLQDDNAGNNESFAITDNLSPNARFDLSCSGIKKVDITATSTSTTASATSTGTSTGTGTASGSAASSTGVATAGVSATNTTNATSTGSASDVKATNAGASLPLSMGAVAAFAALACLL